MERDGKYLEYLEETYRAWFLDGLEAGSDQNLENISRIMGVTLQEVLDAAASIEILKIYESNTADAQMREFLAYPHLKWLVRFFGAMIDLRMPCVLQNRFDNQYEANS